MPDLYMAINKATFIKSLHKLSKNHSWRSIDAIVHLKLKSGHLPPECYYWYKEFNKKQKKEAKKIRRPRPEGVPWFIFHRTPKQQLEARQQALIRKAEASARYYKKHKSQ